MSKPVTILSSICLCLSFLLYAAPLSAQEPNEPRSLLDSTDLGDVLGNEAETIAKKLSDKAADLKEKLVGSKVSSYPVEQRQFSNVQSYNFEQDVRPILDHKCVACHSCYEAPCQLNLADPSGLERGASKIKVYDGTRLRDIAPTRLKIDGQTISDWRGKGFFPVLPAVDGHSDGASPSLMLKFLQLGRSTPRHLKRPDRNQIDLGINRVNSCPAPEEFGAYAAANPHGGMPLAVDGLNEREHAILTTWLREGGKTGPSQLRLTAQERALITDAETWFNNPDRRAQLVSRYLFEHLFLAHLHFETASPGETPTFFRLIRSSTPPGQPAVPLATLRPNDPPGGLFYYRLVPLTERIVHKSHITYLLDRERLTYFESLFLGPNWQAGELPGYDEKYRANPFLAFQAIPARSRYRFLLNDAKFFVRNFIRGPVCNGQVATHVIRDQFWVMFEDPQTERYVNDPAYRQSVDPLLGVPGQNTSLAALGPEWLRYQKRRNTYLDMRETVYRKHSPTGPSLDQVWDGDGTNPNAFLTVFRHHTNASVTSGWQGEFPLTAWLMDYPVFERTFYELVVGFNVFGSVSHQVQTRLYFDLIRNESETNFLRLLPAASRRQLYEHWYKAGGQIKALIAYHKLDTTTPSSISIDTDQPKREVLQKLMDRSPETTEAEDPINRCRTACSEPADDTVTSQINTSLRTIAATRPDMVPGLLQLPDVSFLRVDLPDGDFRVYSLIRNRRHRNVAFIFGESFRYQKHLDTLTILPQLVGSYPNIMFRVNLEDLAPFTRTLAALESEDAFRQLIDRWGVPRLDPEFWTVFHSFSDHLRRHDPIEAGIFDMNRYGFW